MSSSLSSPPASNFCPNSDEFWESLKDRYTDDQIEILREQVTPLENLYPEEFQKYMDLFVTFYPHRPMHIKTSYMGGFICAKGRYKGTGESYDRPCHAGVIAKMLDHDHWRNRHDKATVDDYFWIALREPKRSRFETIDFDNKNNIIGFYRTGLSDHAPVRPVVTITLDHFKAIKRLYDAFPDRIWCVSSATLGLHVWRQLPGLQTIAMIQRDGSDAHDQLGTPEGTRTILKQIGLGNTEIHPMPGRAFRRPFGADYFTITDAGLLADWRDQLRFFENPTHTPAFASIFQAIRTLMVNGWASCNAGTTLNARGKPLTNHAKIRTERPHLASYLLTYGIDIDKLRDDLTHLDNWAEQGFPVDPVIVPIMVPVPVPGGLEIITETKDPRPLAVGPLKLAVQTHLSSINLSNVCNGQWVQSLEGWAINGLPDHDSIFPVISQLARWFFFIEFWDIPENDRFDTIIELLTQYCLTKHNGFISRIEIGHENEVRDQVKRIVHHSIKQTDQLGKLHFGQVRYKRSNGMYRRVILLEPAIQGPAQAETTTYSSSSSVGFICCTVLNDKPIEEQRRELAKQWNYTPNDTPLPDQMMDVINLWKPQKRTIHKLTRFINHLWTQNGEARLGIKSLKKMGFSNHAGRSHLKRLSKAKLIVIGGYCPAQGLSTSYRLTKKAVEMLRENQQERKTA